jgi:hypothetical protein
LPKDWLLHLRGLREEDPAALDFDDGQERNDAKMSVRVRGDQFVKFERAGQDVEIFRAEHTSARRNAAPDRFSYDWTPGKAAS